MSYTAPPMRYDHELIIGDTYLTIAELVDSAGTAFDATGATGVALISTETGGTVLESPAVALVTDGTDGAVQMSLTAAETAALTAQDALFFMRLTFADGTVRTVLEGRVTLRNPLGA